MGSHVHILINKATELSMNNYFHGLISFLSGSDMFIFLLFIILNYFNLLALPLFNVEPTTSDHFVIPI